MEIAMIIKIILMVVFFLEVTIFGRFISKMRCFTSGAVMDLSMTFSGTLFLSIAMIDIIPQAISSFDKFFSQNKGAYESSSSMKQNGYLPLTLIIAMSTFMIIMYIDKILVGQSHDHQYEVSFVQQPKKSHKDHQSLEMKRRQLHEEKVQSDQGPYADTHSHDALTKEDEFNWKPFILQIGMSIHAFFQCLAVGLQKTPIGVLSLASAILVHKWAEGLTLGLMYRKEGFRQRTINIMIIIQGCVNILGLTTGSFLINQGVFVMAFFMSISAGTFFYISLAQVLHQQVKKMTKRKLLAVLLANGFIAFIVWFQKMTEEASQHSQKS